MPVDALHVVGIARRAATQRYHPALQRKGMSDKLRLYFAKSSFVVTLKKPENADAVSRLKEFVDVEMLVSDFGGQPSAGSSFAATHVARKIYIHAPDVFGQK